MKFGDTVKFKDGLYTDKEGTRYKLVEVNGDRVVIEFIRQLPIPPQSIANMDEMELVDRGNDDEKKKAW